ncbi:MAG TPA: outer membrane protein transport protein, partial [bacterium]|nr:outer membrane protein transport protein [bacterium]
MKNLWIATIAGVAGLVIAVSGAQASGFALLEQSAKGLGEAFAGGTTETDDPAAIFYNPAGIAFMERDAVSAGLSVVTIKMDFENQGSYTAAGTPLLGPDSTTDTMGYIPNAFAAFKVADNISAGIGITVPFGLSTRYDRGWVGRYHAVKSNLKSIDISPAVGWQIIPGLLSVGGAVNIQYLDATLTNSVDFGTILSGAGTIPQTLDGYADMNGDDWGIGYSLGACLLLTETTSVGINYRSKIDHTIDGDVDFTVPVQARAILDAIGMSNY